MFLQRNRNFPKRLWVRSKNVFLSSAGLFSLVVTKKSVLRTSSDLSSWNNTSFYSNAEFKCVFLETWSSSFCIVYTFLKVSVQIFEQCRPMSRNAINLPLKMTLRAAQSLRTELCLAWFSSGEWKRCCEKFERLIFVN